MTEQNPATFIQGGTHPAEGLRRMTASLLKDGEGVVGVSDLVVSERASGANMSVDVAAGRIWIKGTEATFQGTYHAENRATVNLTIGTSDATHPRIDLVVAKVEDASYSGATNAWSLAVVEGTPAASPSAPAAPANSFTLAQVSVAALASSVVDANITDTRTAYGLFSFTSWTPTISGLTLGNGTINEAWYQSIDRIVTCYLDITLGSTSSISGLTVTLPVAANSTRSCHGTAHYYDASSTFTYLGLVISTGSTASAGLHVIDASTTYALRSTIDATTPFTWTTNDRITAEVTYLSAAV